MAVAPDGKHLFVISSGRGEGDPKKPLPALEVVAIDSEASSGRLVGRLDFDASDDLDRFVACGFSARPPSFCCLGAVKPQQLTSPSPHLRGSSGEPRWAPQTLPISRFPPTPTGS